MSTDTPRTNAAAIGFARLLIDKGTPDNPQFNVTEIIPADFARELERELSAQWRPIESAPIGTDVLLWDGSGFGLDIAMSLAIGQQMQIMGFICRQHPNGT